MKQTGLSPCAFHDSRAGICGFANEAEAPQINMAGAKRFFLIRFCPSFLYSCTWLYKIEASFVLS